LTLSLGFGVERNQPLMRDCTGDASGLGDSEGNDVRLLVSSFGEGARLRLRLSDVFELRFDGRMRAMLRCRGSDRVELCEVVRTRSTDPGVSMAAMSVSGSGRAHAGDYGVSSTGEGTGGGGAVVEAVRRVVEVVVFVCICHACGTAASYADHSRREECSSALFKCVRTAGGGASRVTQGGQTEWHIDGQQGVSGTSLGHGRR
jgi:hypothetical protein